MLSAWQLKDESIHSKKTGWLAGCMCTNNDWPGVMVIDGGAHHLARWKNLTEYTEQVAGLLKTLKARVRRV